MYFCTFSFKTEKNVCRVLRVLITAKVQLHLVACFIFIIIHFITNKEHIFSSLFRCSNYRGTPVTTRMQWRTTHAWRPINTCQTSWASRTPEIIWPHIRYMHRPPRQWVTWVRPRWILARTRNYGAPASQPSGTRRESTASPWVCLAPTPSERSSWTADVSDLVARTVHVMGCARWGHTLVHT